MSLTAGASTLDAVKSSLDAPTKSTVTTSAETGPIVLSAEAIPGERINVFMRSSVT